MAPTPSSSGRPESLQAYAERRIKTAVADGSVAPGSRLSPQLLAGEFGLSHIPVREALASLASAGYVDHAPGRGYAAKALSSEDLTDVYLWRQVLEDGAYRIAVPLLTDDDLEAMGSLVTQMDALTSRDDRLAFIELNRIFHFIPFRRVGSDRLLRFLDALWDAAAPYASLEMTDSVASQSQHNAAMPLFRARDVEGVITAMGEHRGARITHVVEWESHQAEAGAE